MSRIRRALGMLSSGRTLSLVCAIVSSCLVVGCGSASMGDRAYETTAVEEAMTNDEALLAKGEAYDYGDDVPSSNESQSVSGDTTHDGTAEQSASDKVVIRSAVVSLKSRDYDKTLDAIRTIISEAQGEIFDSSEYGGSSRTITIEARVDPTSLEAAVEALRTIEGSQVVSANVSASDVTRTYDDTERRIDILNEQYEHYRQMLDEAATVEDMLTISDRMYELMEEIKTYTDRRDDLRHDAARSQLTVTLTEVEALGESTGSMGSAASDAFADSWGAFTTVLTRLAVLLIMALPYLVIAAVVFALARLWRRSHPKGRRRGDANVDAAEGMQTMGVASRVDQGVGDRDPHDVTSPPPPEGRLRP